MFCRGWGGVFDSNFDFLFRWSRKKNYVWFIIGTLNTSNREISNGQLHASTSTEKITSFSPQQSGSGDGIHINYLLAGVGAVMSLCLLILVIQLFKKHKSAGRKLASQRMANENDARDKSTNQSQNLNKKVSYQTLKGDTSVRCVDHMSPEYHEIDERLEKHNPFFHPCSCSSGNDVSRLTTNSSDWKQLQKNTCLDLNNSDAYLQPL